MGGCTPIFGFQCPWFGAMSMTGVDKTLFLIRPQRLGAIHVPQEDVKIVLFLTLDDAVISSLYCTH